MFSSGDTCYIFVMCFWPILSVLLVFLISWSPVKGWSEKKKLMYYASTCHCCASFYLVKYNYYLCFEHYNLTVKGKALKLLFLKIYEEQQLSIWEIIMSIFSVSFCARENRNKNCIFAFDYIITNTKSDQEISKKEEEEETSSFYVIFLCFKPTESN